MNKRESKIKNTIYISTQKNEILMNKSNKICTRHI